MDLYVIKQKTKLELIGHIYEQQGRPTAKIYDIKNYEKVVQPFPYFYCQLRYAMATNYSSKTTLKNPTDEGQSHQSGANT